jgi:hypothetical protein
VLGFLFKISQENNPELNELLDAISKVKDEQSLFSYFNNKILYNVCKSYG